MSSRLYFAYGSNMSSARLGARLEGVVHLGRARLFCHTLCFDKAGKDGTAKCNCRFSGNEQDQVHGVLFALPEGEFKKLDRIEGEGHGYQRSTVEVLDDDGRRCLAEIYLATAVDEGLRPYSWYLRHVLEGARENNLPASYCKQIEQVQTIEDPDGERAARELSLYV
jgi:cation transport regulator ChaC